MEIGRQSRRSRLGRRRSARRSKSTTSDYDREKLQERLAKLVGGVAVVKVGAATETEMKEKKARVEDALHATRAAVEEGIVAGGGVPLHPRPGFVWIGPRRSTTSRQIGVQHRATARIEEPIRQIAANAGEEGSIIVQRVREGKDDFGFNAADRRIWQPHRRWASSTP